jgi:hypothetical protein
MATAAGKSHISQREDHARRELGIEGGMAIGVVERRGEEAAEAEQFSTRAAKRRGGGKGGE